MAYSVYNTIRSINALFMFNFMLCALFFWAAHPLIIDEEKHYFIFTRILDDPYLSIVSAYLIVYGVMSLFFSILYVLFKTYRKDNPHRMQQYLKIFLVLVFIGFILNFIGWYYWGLIEEYNLSGFNMVVSMIGTYIHDLIFIYLKGVILWFASTMIITTLLVKQGFISDQTFDK